MNRIKCFWLEATDEAEMSLRRFKRGEAPCPGRYGYHNANVAIERIPFPRSNGFQGDHTGTHDHADPRWPSKCEFCDYLFEETDHWQVMRVRLYRHGETGELYTCASAPVGAMYDAPWYSEHGFAKKEPDGVCLVVKTPGGEWIVDGPCKNGGYWTREGKIPEVTARPSILFEGRYHGWLTNGWLEEC